ncbi:MULTISPECIES: cupin domain-containing protein [unclassified Gluconobacter]|uniref:cupin domain-containing protein n=1 Tax=unclassified Gluconobacter TaxID=2644261 RepID=UPI0017701CCB|nr:MULTISPECIES: cupin domain-containing protein [unclassified Gluconobacter]GFE96967.1 hypothetical protein DmGdi_20400 [Gluconobacter sp. Gdi]
MKISLGILSLLFAPGFAAAQVVHPDHVPAIYPAPGSTLQEFIGIGSALPSHHQSIALFTLTAGTTYPESYNRRSEEIFLIHEGEGTVWLGDQITLVKAGDIIRISPHLKHKIAASPHSPLSFYAISAPPFTADDYILTPPR